MKTHLKLLLVLHLLFAFRLSALAQGTAFTYQGQLIDSGNPANGTYDIRAGLYTNSTGGTALYGPIANSGVAVSNGLFTIQFDYGPVFDGTIYWMQVAVRTNGASSFTVLSPRQQLTPAPYAVFATTASNVTGTISSSGFAGTYSSAVTLNNSADQFTGTFTGSGSGLTNVNATTLGGLSAAGFWQTTGNAGITPGVNFIGTTDNHALDLYANNVRALRLIMRTDPLGNYSNAPNVIGGSPLNQVSSAVVGGTVGGGGAIDNTGNPYPNQVNAYLGTVGGGFGNTITSAGLYGFIGGGGLNTNSGGYAVVGGGANNIASGAEATVGGGYFNISSALMATIGGGYNNTASAIGAFIGGGGNDGSTSAGNFVNSKAASIVGGLGNRIPASAQYAFIGGGNSNTNAGFSGSLSGGFNNAVNGDYGTVAGGAYNTANGNGSFIGGGGYDGSNYYGNVIQGKVGTIGGGFANYIGSGGIYSFIGGGYANQSSGAAAALGGGFENNASGDYSFIGGGLLDIAAGQQATVGGGSQNDASGYGSTVPGGTGNTASGEDSFAAGTFATAKHDGSFVWADDENFYYSSSFTNGFFARCTGGARIITAVDGSGTPTAGVKLNAGDTAWSAISDRNAKKNFQPVDPVAVLDKLAAIPVEHWNYKWEADTNTPHLGPMAQDFKAAFYPGRDDKSISTLEFDGVELAAIQGLNEKLETKTRQLENENAELKQQLAELKAIVNQLAHPK